MVFSLANFWIDEITDLTFSLKIIPRSNMGPEKLCDFDVKGQLSKANFGIFFENHRGFQDSCVFSPRF